MKSALMTKLTMAAVGAAATMTFGTATSAQAADLTFTFTTRSFGTGGFNFTGVNYTLNPDGTNQQTGPQWQITGNFTEFYYARLPVSPVSYSISGPISDGLLFGTILGTGNNFFEGTIRSIFGFPLFNQPQRIELVYGYQGQTGIFWGGGMGHSTLYVRETTNSGFVQESSEPIISWSATRVPEPFTITGTLLGLAGVVAARRKRQSAKAS